MTARQAAFVREYLKDSNATQAAIRAGYARKGASVQGARLLANAKVSEAIAIERAHVQTQARIEATDVTRELARLGFSSLRDHASWGPEGVCVEPSDHLTESAARPLREISETSTTYGTGRNQRTVRTVRVRMHDKVGPLNALAKHLGLFRETEATQEMDRLLNAMSDVIRRYVPDEEAEAVIIELGRRASGT